ncbi:MAG: restriction endonuclease subunit S [Arcicella sp.]|nr:restriction endonuclease subunit S [Arcicella sp.]
MTTIGKYNKYQNTNLAWAENIPEHWKVYRIKHQFQIIKRIVGELGYNVLSITQKGIKVKDTTSGGGQLAMDYSKYQLTEIGDFAMNHMDLLTGFVDISKYHGVISPDYRVFKLTQQESDSKYLLYVLQLCYAQKIFFGHGKGVSMLGRWRLPAENFKNFTIPIPPLEEQTNIAAFLDFKLAKIARFILKKKQLLALYVERRKSLTKKIINSESVQFLRLSSITDLVQRPIDRIDNEFYTPIGLYNRGRGIFHKELTLGKDLGDSNFCYIEKGDVILSGQFAWEGAVALASSSDENCVASHRYPILKCYPEVIKPEFLFSFFTISEGHLILDSNSRGSAGRNRPLNPRYLIKEKIPVPPISLQEELVEMIQSENQLNSIINREISLIEEYKTILISEAVTGKIDVRDYEIPASLEDESYEELEDELSLVEEEEIGGE